MLDGKGRLFSILGEFSCFFLWRYPDYWNGLLDLILNYTDGEFRPTKQFPLFLRNSTAARDRVPWSPNDLVPWHHAWQHEENWMLNFHLFEGNIHHVSCFSPFFQFIENQDLRHKWTIASREHLLSFCSWKTRKTSEKKKIPTLW